MLGSWQVGYGHVNLDQAVALVTRDRLAGQARGRRRTGPTAALRPRTPGQVTRADLWQEAAPPVAAGGSYTATHRVEVGRRADALKIALVYPTPGTAANLASFVATVTDASGKLVGTTTTNVLYATGVAHALVKGIEPGTYTVDVSGDYAASDPDTLDSDSVNGRVVFLQAAQLRHR